VLQALQQRDRRRVRDGQPHHSGLDVAKIGREFEPSKGAIALHVDDVEAARAKLEARGVAFDGETMDSGVCYQAFFQDQDGNALILHHRYAAPGVLP
jgi:hypothetical protein